MHEYYLTQQIVQAAERHMLENGGNSVEEIRLVIGNDAGCSFETMELYFDIIAEKTVCEGAVLKAERVKPMLCCKKCGTLFERKPFSFECGKCNGEGAPTEIGREFYIRSIIVN